MHAHDSSAELLTTEIVRYAVERVRLDPPPLDGPRTPEELRRLAGETITEEGIGGREAMRIYEEVLAPACISVDHPKHLSFVPTAPTEAAVLFDLVVGASSICATSWLEGAGAIFAENEALRWLADLAGLPVGAGGTFVSGGTAGNLSALVAARWDWRRRTSPANDRTRGLIVAGESAHSSVAQAARVLDADVVDVPTEPSGTMRGEELAAALVGLDAVDRDRLFAVIATAGTTNSGSIDELDAVGEVAADHGTWLHVDAAYGGAALVAPSARPAFAGIERADSLIVDPHKWLFAPFDACALLYRDPAIARSAHTQHAGYLDVLHSGDPATEPWNASDYAHHLTRRARGLPFWFSLAAYGTAAYAEAVETTLRVTRAAAAMLVEAPHTELLLEPQLSIVLFRRKGWEAPDYQRWSDRELAAGRALVTPTSWQGEVLLRLCVVNPSTTTEHIAEIIDSLHLVEER
jgi:glutamate/tyrosine decarboxylase-like PLP-dependent enzyme